MDPKVVVPVFNLSTPSPPAPQFAYYQPILPHGSGALASFSYAFGSTALSIIPSELHRYSAYAPNVSGSVRLASGNYWVNTINTGAIDIYVVNYGPGGGATVTATGFLVQSVPSLPSPAFGSFSVSVAGLTFNTSDYIGFVVNHVESQPNVTNFVIEATLLFQW